MEESRALGQLAARLRALRTDAGLTLRELSGKVHVSDSSLSRYFAAQALPPWEVVAAMAGLAGADLDDLRRCWESASQARKLQRWLAPAPRTVTPVVTSRPSERPVPDPGLQVATLVVVVALVAAAGAAGWALGRR